MAGEAIPPRIESLIREAATQNNWADVTTNAARTAWKALADVVGADEAGLMGQISTSASHTRGVPEEIMFGE